IVFGMAQDPVKLGLVASLARPGGNLTGVNFLLTELAAKRLEMLCAMVPTAKRSAVLVNPAQATNTESTLQEVQAGAQAIGLQIRVLNVGTNREIDAAFASFEHERPDALFIGSGSLFNGRRVQLTQWAAHHRIPASYAGREFVEAGGLVSYGSNSDEAYRQCGGSVCRILQGGKPADLAGREVNQVGFGDQRPNCQNARPHRAGQTTRTCGRGDRVSNRREFITLLGGMAVAWPLAARAQQFKRKRRIGVLMAHAESDAEFHDYLSAFRRGLPKLGWMEGRNIQIESRWGALDDAEARQRSGKELIALQPDVILTQNTPPTASMLEQTRTIPIVFVVVADPVGSGFVQSLARPGANA